MGKYKIEVWQHHRKIDEYENDDPKKVDSWYKKKYQLMDDWGECCYYKFVANKDVGDLKQAQRDELRKAKAVEDFTDEEKEQIIDLIITNCYEVAITPNSMAYCDLLDPHGTLLLREIRFYPDSLLGAKLLNRIYKKYNRSTQNERKRVSNSKH